MKKLIAITLSILLIGIYTSFMACGNISSGSDQSETLDSTQIEQKIISLQEKISHNRFKKENAQYLKKIAELAYQKQDYKMSFTYYLWALQADPKIKGHKKIINILIGIADKQFRDKTTADMFKTAFIEAYPLAPQVPSYKKSFGSFDSLKALLTIFKDNMSRSEEGVQNPISKRVIDGSEIYGTVLYFKDDAPSVILDAAFILQTKKLINKALSFYDWILTKYPDSKYAAESLFMKAYIFGTDVGDTAKAHKYYQEFIDKFPNHELADDAQSLINMLGKEFTPPSKSTK